MNCNPFDGHGTRENYDRQIEAAIKSLFYFGRDAILLFDRQGTIFQCNIRALTLLTVKGGNHGTVSLCRAHPTKEGCRT